VAKRIPTYPRLPNTSLNGALSRKCQRMIVVRTTERLTDPTPVQAPRANAIMERWIGSCRREILDRTLVWNLSHLRRVLAEYEDHYNRHRPHRALHQASPLKALPEPADLDQLKVRRRDRLGGILHEYAQVA
jgi:putative transposase